MTAPGAILKTHLEHPEFLPRHRVFHVQGWVVARSPVRGARIDGPRGTPLELRHRPDVLRVFPDFPHAIGFFGVARSDQLAGTTLPVRIETDDESATTSFLLDPESLEALDLRRSKLERVYPLLRCISCGGRFPDGGFSMEADRIQCSACGRAYDCSTGAFDLLPDEARAALEPTNRGNVSANHYDTSALEFIERHRDGVVLDCGAGLRLTEYANVVNLEVSPYRSTDVLGVNESLPFQDGSFDGVLSLAVLEHVKDPFASARELTRVCKPGGALLIVVPLLAPVHAYPDHYYNMTSAGLVNLLPANVEVLETRVPESGLPIWALTWILRSWVEGLSGSARESFLNMRVSELLEEGAEYLARDFVTGLARDTNFELAGTTLVRARKRG